MADPVNPLELSDDDIANMTEPPASSDATDAIAAAATGAEGQAAPAEPAAAPAAQPTSEPAAAPAEGDAATTTGGDAEPQLVDPLAQPKADAVEPVKPESEAQAKPEGQAAEPKSPAAEAPSGYVAPTPEAALAFHEQIMKPFKANGKTIELRSPEEAIQLMQMGANYTKKLQDLQPHRKMVMMLENNGLLDEGKLSYLIDLDRKDPAAIKKLIKDAGIDPLEIDTTTDPAYVAGNHRVSDEEASFRATLDDLASNQAGTATLAEINTTWDQASKEVLWQSPEIMSVIHEQRDAGIYDVIKAEVDRQITLGHIPPNTPFLQAYKTVGDAMAAQALGTAGGNGGQAEGASVPGQVQPQVLGTRTATPKSTVANGAAASAASPTRATPATKPPLVNPLAESDEAFLKRMENRL